MSKVSKLNVPSPILGGIPDQLVVRNQGVVASISTLNSASGIVRMIMADEITVDVGAPSPFAINSPSA